MKYRCFIPSVLISMLVQSEEAEKKSAQVLKKQPTDGLKIE